MLVCDGLKGLPDAVSAVWEKTIVQTCIVHLLRNSFKYASKRDWAQIAKDLRPVYAAASESEALDRFAEFSGKWEKRYPAIIRLWENAWAEFVPFLRFDREIRTVICTTNAIESINARLRRAVNARGHFPTEQAALKYLYLAIMSLDPTGQWPCFKVSGGIVTVSWRMMVLKGSLRTAGCRTGSRLVCWPGFSRRSWWMRRWTRPGPGSSGAGCCRRGW